MSSFLPTADTGSSGVSSGGIAGIIIGVLLVAAGSAVAVFMLRRWRGSKGGGVTLTSNGGFDNALYSQSEGQVGFSSNGVSNGGKVSESNGTIHCNGEDGEGDVDGDVD